MIFRLNETLHSASKLLVSRCRLEINRVSRLILAGDSFRGSVRNEYSLRVDIDDSKIVLQDLREAAVAGGEYAMKTARINFTRWKGRAWMQPLEGTKEGRNSGKPD